MSNLPDISDTGAIIRCTPPCATLGEGPLWSVRDNGIYWVDILGHKLHFYSLSDGTNRTWFFPEPIGWVIEREKGGFIAGLMSGFAEVTLDPFTFKHIVNPYPHEPENRLNDAKADNLGRIWAGSMHKPIAKTSGAFYRLNTDLTHKEVDGPYHIANGPTFSKDFSKIYHTDTDKGEVYAFDLIDGELANKRVFVKFEESWGGPDGMTTDSDDGVWIAHWGPGWISRFNPDGTRDFTIDMPAKQITCITFAGPNLDRAFVTSAAKDQPEDKDAGSLFELPKALLRGHTGLPTQKFKG